MKITAQNTYTLKKKITDQEHYSSLFSASKENTFYDMFNPNWGRDRTLYNSTNILTWEKKRFKNIKPVDWLISYVGLCIRNNREWGISPVHKRGEYYDVWTLRGYNPLNLTDHLWEARDQKPRVTLDLPDFRFA